MTGVCGAVGADIVSLNLVERGGGFVIDELCLTGVDDPGQTTSEGLIAGRRAVDQNPGRFVVGWQ